MVKSFKVGDGLGIIASDITERKRAEEELRRYTERLQILHDIDQGILAAQSPEAIAQATLGHIRQLAPCQRTSVVVFDHDANQATVLAIDDNGGSKFEETRPAIDYDIAKELWQGKTKVMADLLADPQLSPTNKDLLDRGIRSYINVPLLVRGQLIGALNLGASEPDVFTSEYVAIAREVADQLAIAIQQARLHEQVQRHAEELGMLYQAAQRLQQLYTPETVAQAIVQILEEMLAYEYSRVLLIDEPTGRLVSFAGSAQERGAVSVEDDKAYIASHDLRLGKGITGWVAQTGQSLRVGDARRDPRYYSVLDDTRSELCVPLRVGDWVIGVVNIETTKLNAYTEADQRLLETVAAQIAVAIQNAHLYEQVQRHAEELEQRVADRTRELSALYEVTAVASESLGLETTLARSLERVLEAMRSDVGLIHLLDEEGKGLRLAAQQGIPPDLVLQIESIPAQEGLARWVIEHDELLILPDITPDPRLSVEGTAPPRRYIGVPMQASGQVVGVLAVLRETTQPSFGEEEVALLTSIADQVGAVVESTQLRERAEQAAVMEERQRLARDLHDSVTQSLYSVTLLAETGRRSVQAGNVENVAGYLARLGEVAQQALKEMRLLIYELRPPKLEREGLAGALQERLDAVEGRTGIEARLLVEAEVELPAAVEEAFYRIALEALNNVLKHAAATFVTVRICPDGERAELEIVDDGQGFDLNTVSDMGGMGLITMQERAEQLGGELTILSVPEEGTSIRVTVETGNPSSFRGSQEVS